MTLIDTDQPVPLSDIAPRATQVMVPMRDGVKLATDVYVPEGRTNLATALVRTPYDKGSPFTFLPRLADLFNAHGYALIAQDVRGRGRSGGEQRPLEHEVQDGYDTLDWIANQVWSDGNVGMFGDSYLGFTSIAAAVSGHPALRAIVPRMIGTDRGIEHDGVRSLELVEWAANYWMDNRNYARRVDWSVTPLSQVIEQSTGRPCPPYERMRELALSDHESANRAFFGVSDPRGSITIPTLHWTGYWDLRAGPCIQDYLDMRGRPELADRQWLILDAIDHEFYDLDYDGLPAGLGEAPADESIDALLPDYTNAIIEFFNRHVRGYGTADPARVRWRLAHVGWRTADEWPPPRASELALHLSALPEATSGPSGGRLANTTSCGETVQWTHNPSDPVPNNVMNPWSILSDPPDERLVEARPDVLTFTTDTVSTRLDLAGPVTLRVAIEADAPSMHLVAKLVDVSPSGTARRILLGARAIREDQYSQLVRLELGHTGYRVQPGHQLRLEIASSCYPFYEIHPGNGEDPWTAENRTSATMRLLGDGACLTLTVLGTGEK